MLTKASKIGTVLIAIVVLAFAINYLNKKRKAKAMRNEKGTASTTPQNGLETSVLQGEMMYN